MDARDDPRYLRLYQDYSKAIRAFEIATQNRGRVRDQLAVDRSPVIQALRQRERRPVGSPPDTRIPAESPTPPAPRPAPPPRRIYLGNVLGWAEIVYTSPQVPEPEPDGGIDVDKLYDQTSLHLYWNAKTHYLKSKRAFFDHVRRQNVDLHRERATDALSHGAHLQFLGLDESDDPEFIREAKREVEAMCQNAWALYQSGDEKKSPEMKVLLLKSIADAQFVDLESATVQTMTNEMKRLFSNGEIWGEPSK